MPFSGNLPDPEIELTSLASPALAGGFFTTKPPGKPQYRIYIPILISSISVSYSTPYHKPGWVLLGETTLKLVLSF